MRKAFVEAICRLAEEEQAMSKHSGLKVAIVAVTAAAAAALGSFDAAAQAYPARPIRIVVPFPPGGGTDIGTRIVGQKLQDALGQPVVIENKPGASGIVGSEFTAKATPDGYTLMMANIGTHAINVSLFKKLSYDPVKDFAPISQVALLPMFLLVHPAVPAGTPILTVSALTSDRIVAYLRQPLNLDLRPDLPIEIRSRSFRHETGQGRVLAVGTQLESILPELLPAKPVSGAIAEYGLPFYFGGTSLLIIVVVTMDFMAQVQAYVMTHQYESLLRKASFKGGLPVR